MSEDDQTYWQLSAIDCAFCLGDVDRISTAFLGHVKRAFRQGLVADRFVELCMSYRDAVGPLADSAAEVTGRPPVGVFEPSYIAGGDEVGMWVEILPAAWVELLSAIPEGELQAVFKALSRRLAAEGDSGAAAVASDASEESLRHLIEVAQESLRRNMPLIGLSAI